MITIELSRISMNMVEATVVSWNVSVGEHFKTGDVLCEIETEKVTSGITAEVDGELIEILAPAGAEIEVGEPLCRIRPF